MDKSCGDPSSGLDVGGSCALAVGRASANDASVLSDDGAPLAFARLWEGWRDPAGEVLRTFTIATTAANEDMAQLHERMPVILEPAAWPVWMGEKEGDFAALLRLAPAGTVRLWPVSRAVNSVRNNGPELLVQAIDAAPLTPAEALLDINPA